jgi:hypothetical protein
MNDVGCCMKAQGHFLPQFGIYVHLETLAGRAAKITKCERGHRDWGGRFGRRRCCMERGRVGPSGPACVCVWGGGGRGKRAGDPTRTCADFGAGAVGWWAATESRMPWNDAHSLRRSGSSETGRASEPKGRARCRRQWTVPPELQAPMDGAATCHHGTPKHGLDGPRGLRQVPAGWLGCRLGG